MQKRKWNQSRSGNSILKKLSQEFPTINKSKLSYFIRDFWLIFYANMNNPSMYKTYREVNIDFLGKFILSEQIGKYKKKKKVKSYYSDYLYRLNYLCGFFLYNSKNRYKFVQRRKRKLIEVNNLKKVKKWQK
jgi:hypothetical protein